MFCGHCVWSLLLSIGAGASCVAPSKNCENDYFSHFRFILFRQMYSWAEIDECFVIERSHRTRVVFRNVGDGGSNRVAYVRRPAGSSAALAWVAARAAVIGTRSSEPPPDEDAVLREVRFWKIPMDVLYDPARDPLWDAWLCGQPLHDDEVFIQHPASQPVRLASPQQDMKGCPFFEVGSITVKDADFPVGKSFRFRGSFDGGVLMRPRGSVAALDWIVRRLQNDADIDMLELPRILEEADFWGVPRHELCIKKKDSLLESCLLMRGSDDVHDPNDVFRCAAAGDLVVKPIPYWITRLVRGTGLALCGGAAVRAWCGFVTGDEDVCDYDIYAIGPGGWQRSLRAARALVDGRVATLVVTGSALTLRFAGTPEVLQFVREEFADLDAVFESFDLDCCCVAFVDDSFTISPRADRARRMRRNVADPAYMAGRSAGRLRKYARRGWAGVMYGCGDVEVEHYARFPKSWAEKLLKSSEVEEEDEDEGSGSLRNDFKTALQIPTYEDFRFSMFTSSRRTAKDGMYVLPIPCWPSRDDARTRPCSAVWVDVALSNVGQTRRQAGPVDVAGAFALRRGVPHFELDSNGCAYVTCTDAMRLESCKFDDHDRVVWLMPDRPDEWRRIELDALGCRRQALDRALAHVVSTMQRCLRGTWASANDPVLNTYAEVECCMCFADHLDRAVQDSRRPASLELRCGGRKLYAAAEDALRLQTCRLSSDGVLEWEHPDVAGSWHVLLLELREVTLEGPPPRAATRAAVKRMLHEDAQMTVVHPAMRHLVGIMKRCVRGPWFDDAYKYRGELVEDMEALPLHAFGVFSIEIRELVRFNKRARWRRWAYEGPLAAL